MSDLWLPESYRPGPASGSAAANAPSTMVWGALAALVVVAGGIAAAFYLGMVELDSDEVQAVPVESSATPATDAGHLGVRPW